MGARRVSRVSVIIPTFRRPEGFLRAARSVLAQRANADVELIAIDNASEAPAAEAFALIQTEARIPFRHAHEPRPGVAHARNAGLALAQGDFIVWLDDDEEAPQGWLDALLRVQAETGADAVFGPVRARASAKHARNAYIETLYSRAGPAASGVTEGYFGIGNSLQKRALFTSAAPFDIRANQTGGEDDRLFAQAQAAGARFAWAAEADVIEHVDAARLDLAHAFKRAFAYGQGPCETAWSKRAYADLARHMAIGAGQALVFGLAALFAWCGKARQRFDLTDRAARGAGKLLWFWEQKFYGA